MTVIAYDGRHVAADRMAASSGVIRTVTKLFVDGKRVMAICGQADHGMMMVAWVKSGAAPDQFPTPANRNDCAYLYVFERGKHVIAYQTHPLPLIYEDELFAGGCGGDVAMGAMLAGKSAAEAVQIASTRDIHCGCGYDAVDLEAL